MVTLECLEVQFGEPDDFAFFDLSSPLSDAVEFTGWYLSAARQRRAMSPVMAQASRFTCPESRRPSPRPPRARCHRCRCAGPKPSSSWRTMT